MADIEQYGRQNHSHRHRRHRVKPFSITKADGSLTGFDVDFMQALCNEMKTNCEINPQDWDSLLPGLMAKKYDVVIDAMSITPERQAQVDFTDPILSIRWCFDQTGSPSIQMTLLKLIAIRCRPAFNAINPVDGKNHPKPS